VTVDSATSHIGIGTINIFVNVTKGACAVNSDTISITFTVCVGLVEYSNNTNIRLYPNPTTGMVNIEVNGIDGNAFMKIYSPQGQVIYSKELNSNLKADLDLSRLSKGVYFIKINNEETNIFSKLIIQ
jgi:hypothetical protein